MMRRSIVCIGVFAVLGAFPAVSASASKPVSHLKRVCSVSTSPQYAACMAIAKADANGNLLVDPDLPSGLSPAKFHSAYNLPTTVATHHKIAIVDAFNDPNIYADLRHYVQTYGLPTFRRCTSATQGNCFLVLNQNGKTSPLPPNSHSWATEIALDVEVAHAICQNCRIELIEANSNSFANLKAAVNTAAKRGAEVISNSYGAYLSDCAGMSAYNKPNVAVTVSAGDSGFGVACPAVLNTVVAVGGTTLTLNGDGSYNSESVWSGSGSGCSSTNSAQTWQTATATWAAIGCSGRGMNDVSAVGDPNTGAAVYDSYGAGGWVQVGGTSLSAPLIGAVYALAGNAPSFTYPAQSVYASPGSLHDVLTGTNGSCIGHPLQCGAGVGYDLPTGIGTPNGLGGF
jgi:subtilase family serine protease